MSQASVRSQLDLSLNSHGGSHQSGVAVRPSANQPELQNPNPLHRTCSALVGTEGLSQNRDSQHLGQPVGCLIKLLSKLGATGPILLCLKKGKQHSATAARRGQRFLRRSSLWRLGSSHIQAAGGCQPWRLPAVPVCQVQPSAKHA